MARDINVVLVSGNLGRDPERFKSESGKSRVEFSIACNEQYVATSGDRKEKTTWFNCVAFDSTADFCYQYVTKGAKVYILGKWDVRKYEGRDGTEKTSYKVIVNQINLAPGSRPRKEEDDEPSRSPGSYGPDGGPHSAHHHAGPPPPPEQPPLPPLTPPGDQYDEQGRPIITDDDIPF